MTYVYYPKGVCSKKYVIDIEDEIITGIHIEAGCPGNLQGIAKLLVGQRADRAAELLSGIRCEKKSTSCPDQISVALREALEQIRSGGVKFA